MITTLGDRSRRRAAAASILTSLAVAVGAIVLTVAAGAPKTWWPHTGQAFTAGTSTSHRSPCTRIHGPAKAYCERDAAATAGRRNASGAAWRLGTAGAGVAALVVWRQRAGGPGRY
ncbi:hypothetical protein [Streptomyces similanensis]|uniref:Uncharacterized protein n=1 Tax=Streptomyces similanensis TaxID=1274988 RepID=A0ABP9LLD1_9ACTN